MESVEVHRLVERVLAAGAPGADRDALAAGLADAERLAGWVDAQRLELARRLATTTARPERAVADAARVSPRAAERLLERAETAAEVPVFADALADGRVSAAHLDAVGRGLRRVGADRRADLVERLDGLVGVAQRCDAETFGRAVTAEVRRLEADGGMSRFDQQRRATRLRTWVDVRDGMWHLHGVFDPHTGVVLDGRLRAMVDTLFAESTPDTCPPDPLDKHQHLQALALVALTEGRGVTTSRPEVVVVVDTAVADATGGPVVDWGLPVEVPQSVLVDTFGAADVHTVVHHRGVVLHAPGTLDLGRATRIANRAQRRVLRAWYGTCAIPGCEVRFDHCRIHHVTWWRHGGPTDLENLLPVCSRHHHAVHDDGWQLVLTPERVLTIRYPNGETMTTGPPRRAAA